MAPLSLMDSDGASASAPFSETQAPDASARHSAITGIPYCFMKPFLVMGG